jgi:hypothetical protein
MAAARRQSRKKPSTRGPRGPRGKTGKRGAVGKSSAEATAMLVDQMQDVQKELARLLRRIGEIQAQLDRLAADEPAERTG